MADVDGAHGGGAEDVRDADAPVRVPAKPCEGAAGGNAPPPADAVEALSFADVSPKSGTNMRPLALVYDGREHPLGGMWQNLTIVLCHLLDALYPNLLKGFADAKFIPNLSLDEAGLRRGQEIDDLGVWFEKNLSARDFIHQARRMLEAFRVDPAQVAVKMEPRFAPQPTPAASSPAVPQEGFARTRVCASAPASADGERIGAYAKREIYAALAEGRVPDDDFARLQTSAGTRGMLGFSLTGCPLFSFSRAMMERTGGQGCWRDPAMRNGRAVYVNSQWYGSYRAGLNRLLARWRGAAETAGGNVPASPGGDRIGLGDLAWAYDAPGTTMFENDLRKNYPNGFNFSESARWLVEGRLGRPMMPDIVKSLKRKMFARGDGMRFFIDQIADAVVRDEIVSVCGKWLKDHSFVVLNVLVPEFRSRLSNLYEDSDRAAYVECVLRSGESPSCGIVNRRGGRICFSTGYLDLDGLLREFADEIASLLRERDDAVAISEICELHPNVTEKWFALNAAELISDVVIEDFGDGNQVCKLVESYYLPDDFAEAFAEAVEQLVSDGDVVSVGNVVECLGRRYDCDLLSDYALSDDAFKQIATRLDPDHRKWKKNQLVIGGKDDPRQSPSIWMELEKRFPGIFVYDDFVELGRTLFRWSEQTLRTQGCLLSRHCIRYNQDTWSSVGHFKAATGWTDEIAKSVSAALSDWRGSAVYFPMDRVVPQMLDALPELQMNGRRMAWTKELVVSVAYLCLPEIHVINHAVAPNFVTAMLVPPSVPRDADAVEYMVRQYMLRRPNVSEGGDARDAYVDDAIAFLVENSVRRRLSSKLRDNVRRILSQGNA